MKIYLSMYTPFTGRKNRAGKDGKLLDDLLKDKGLWEKRNMNLGIKIQNAYSLLLKKGFDKDNEIALFIAPEWYFRPKDKHYTELEMKYIIDTLLEVSSEYNGLIICPGTIYWGKKTLNGNWNVLNCCPVICSGELVSFVHKFNEADIDTSKKKSKEERWKIKKEEVLNQINKEMGEKFKKFIKEPTTDFFEGVFEYRKTLFGLEICKDHVLTRLKHYLQSVKGEKRHVQILISAGAGLNSKALVVEKGGFFIGCDANESDVATNYKNCITLKKCINYEIKGINKTAFGKVIEVDNEKEIYHKNGKIKDDEKDFDFVEDIIIYKKPLEFGKTLKNEETTEEFIKIIKE